MHLCVEAMPNNPGNSSAADRFMLMPTAVATVPSNRDGVRDFSFAKTLYLESANIVTKRR